MQIDLKNNIDIAQSIPPAVQSADATGVGVDLANFHSAMVEFITGADVAGTHAPKVQESDTLGSGYTDVDAADLIGTLPADMAADSIFRQGYKGAKQFIRAFVTTSGASLIYGANVIRANPRKAPVA